MADCGLVPEASDAKGKGKSKKKNPNEESLRDVGRFKLGLSAGGRAEDDVWYYIKPR